MQVTSGFRFHKICEYCKKDYGIFFPSGNIQKYCSPSCAHKASIGKKLPRTHNENAVRGARHYAWKGDQVKYGGVHAYIYKKLGKPSKCEICKTTTAKRFEWANKDHQYKRNTKDWIRLCCSCHKKFDRQTRRIAQFSLDNVLIQTFDAIMDAQRFTHIDNGSIGRVLRGTQQTTGGYKWKYL